MDNMLKIRQTLTDSIFEVFERMFYVFLEPLDGRDDELHYQAGISFNGPINGELSVFFSRPLAEMMLKNMLNIGEEEINDQLLEDCLKESVNMICGNFLSNHDAGQVFDLSIPAYTAGRQVDGNKAAGNAEAVRLDFAGGEGRLMILMTFPGPDQL